MINIVFFFQEVDLNSNKRCIVTSDIFNDGTKNVQDCIKFYYKKNISLV